MDLANWIIAIIYLFICFIYIYIYDVGQNMGVYLIICLFLNFYVIFLILEIYDYISLMLCVFNGLLIKIESYYGIWKNKKVFGAKNSFAIC